MQFSEPESPNPHFPVNNGSWRRPQRELPRGIFQTPERSFDYTDVPGSQSRPQIDLSVPAKCNDKTISNPSPKLFATPRSLDKSVDNAGRMRYSYIPTNREPTPSDKGRFYRTGIINTKYVGTTSPQIDLTKQVRQPTDFHREVQPLFASPREVPDIAGSHPRVWCDPKLAPRDLNKTIPNRDRFMVRNPIDPANKYSDLPETHTRAQIDLNRPVRDPMRGEDLDRRPRLFEQPRDIFKLPEDQRKPRPMVRPRDEGVEDTRPQLFRVPRDITNKYEDLPGSHPEHFRQGQVKIVCDRFKETGDKFTWVE